MKATIIIDTGDNLKIIDLSWLLVFVLLTIHDLVMFAGAIVDLWQSVLMAANVIGRQVNILTVSFAWGLT